MTMNWRQLLSGRPLRRRAVLAAGAAGAAAWAGGAWLRRGPRQRAAVFVARGQRYDGGLTATLRAGLLAVGVVPAEVRGRRVLLKPNLVEPTRAAPHMTTHPAMVLAAADVFRGWGAAVTVGEAPGHVRDTELALVESGLQQVLDTGELPFEDLNYQEAVWVENAGGRSRLSGFYLPRAVAEADLVVSLPKMKTHHWVGMTAAMKNLYGVLPGCVYGWPKNVLHHAGIPQTVHDLCATLPRTLAIVDGIVGMEGDGPIMGSPKPLGAVVVGANLPAVDATVARIMGLDPFRVSYLGLANHRLGPLSEAHIEQRGEAWQSVASPFEVLNLPHLQQLRAAAGELVS
jgi:uncharacterized protein (DUF362 family)